MASKQRADDRSPPAGAERKPDNKSAHRDAKTESRMQRPEDLRSAGRGEGSDDHRSGSESGER